MSAGGRPLGGKVIALSVGNGEDLARRGYGPEHLDEAALRIARRLLQLGGKLSFGGGLRAGGFAATFLELVQAELMDERETEPEVKLYSFQPWPRDADVTPQKIAASVGLCHYVRISPDLPPDQQHAHLPNARSPRLAWQRARAYSRMRQAMATGGVPMADGQPAPPSDARIVLGGRRVGFSGAMGGVVEESLYTLEQAQPLFVVGGFGGGARLLARALSDERLPEELTFAYHERESASFRLMLAGFDRFESREVPEGLAARLEAAVKAVRDRGLERGLANGLSTVENERLMSSESLTEILALLGKGLRSLAGRPAGRRSRSAGGAS